MAFETLLICEQILQQPAWQESSIYCRPVLSTESCAQYSTPTPPPPSPSPSDPAQLFPLSTDHNREPSLTLNLCFCITGPLVFFFWAAGPLRLSLLLSLQSKCFIALYRQIQLYSFYLSLHAYIKHYL